MRTVPLLLVAACAGTPPASDDGALTLDSCTTEIADDVPAFYARYFRCVTASMDGDAVVVRSDGLPPHPSAYYPESDPNHVAWDDRGGTHVQNPNLIAAQDLAIRVPAAPTPKELTIDAALVDLTAGTSAEEYPLGPAGIATDGVALFDATAAPGDDIRDEQWTFDTWEGHPEQRGAYHHHAPAPGPLAALAANGVPDGVEVYGMMCDGTVALGCTELDGSAPTGALDAQNGHVHDLVDEQGTTHFTGRYHVHVCATLSDHEFMPEIQAYAACD